MDQKTLTEGWLRLYNRLNSFAYTVIEWPDENQRNRQAIDALCEDPLGNRLAIEHTLIQPFTGAKEDDARGSLKLLRKARWSTGACTSGRGQQTQAGQKEVEAF